MITSTQEHLLVCSKLKTKDKQTIVEEKIKYTHIYGAVGQQKAIVTVIKELLNERNKLLKTIFTSGDSLDPSTHECYASKVMIVITIVVFVVGCKNKK